MVYCVANDDTMSVCSAALNAPNGSNDAIATETGDRLPFAYYIHGGPIHPEHLSSLMALNPVVFHFASKSYRRDRDGDDGWSNEDCNGNYIVDSVIRLLVAFLAVSMGCKVLED